MLETVVLFHMLVKNVIYIFFLQDFFDKLKVLTDPKLLNIVYCSISFMFPIPTWKLVWSVHFPPK